MTSTSAPRTSSPGSARAVSSPPTANTQHPTPFSGMLDAHDRVTGRVAYTINHELPGMLHVKLLRSTSAHARIVSIDVSRAREVPGVWLVVTGDDLKDRPDFQPYFGP